MRYFVTTLLIYAIVPVVIALFLIPQKDNSQILRYPKWFLVLGLLCDSVCIFGIVMMLISKQYENYAPYTNWILLPLVTVIISLGLVSILLPITWRLSILENCLKVRNLIGITRSYSFSEITGVVVLSSKIYGEYAYKIYVNGKYRVRIEKMAINFDGFIRRLKRAMKKSGYNLVVESNKPSLP